MGYLDKTGLAHFWEKIKAAKQNTLVGTTGQVVGFDAEGAAVAVEGWSNMNLLLNSDFRNSVNRNGQAEYTTGTTIIYTFDRWQLRRGSVSLTDDGIVFSANVTASESSKNGWIGQVVERAVDIAGNQVTFSALIDNKLYQVTGTLPPKGGSSITSAITNNVCLHCEWLSTQTAPQIEIFSYSETPVCIKAAKLELGPVQTLARQNADGEWEIIDPPDYDLQYALCSQYSPTTGEWIGSQHSNPNLLDNAYWASKDTIINQRGQDEYTAEGYIIDRWYITENISVRLLDNGIILEHTSPSFIRQTLENPAALSGKTVTLSALLSDVNVNSVTELLRCRINNTFALYNTMVRRDGLCSITFTCPSDITSFHIEIGSSGSNSLVVHAIKLELGPVQTLAHKEGDTWVLNDPPPNKALELVKCQRYQIIPGRENVIYMFALGTGYTTNSIRFFFTLPTTMRAKAAIKFENLYAHMGTTLLKIKEITNYGSVANGIWLHAVVEGTVEIGKAYYLRSESPFSFVIDANL